MGTNVEIAAYPRASQLTLMLRVGILGLSTALLVSSPSWSEDEITSSSYPRTVEALQQRYGDEVRAHRKYAAFADKALIEGYPRIAHLFAALSASEAIHAHNFRLRLNELGIEVNPAIGTDFEVSDTKHNIREATGVEADEIDRLYPQILRDIAPENNGAAIRDITYAWQAERQHRSLIEKIQSAAKRWFGLLAAHIEGDPTDYYVCQTCGSTLTELPAQQCPICAHAPSQYKEIPGWRLPDAPEEENR